MMNNIANGYIKSFRAMRDHPIVGVHNPLMFTLWNELLFEAAYERRTIPYGGRSTTLERGQAIAPRSHLARRLGASEDQIKRLLAKLVREGMIIVTRPTKGRQSNIITICNYDIYQSEQPTERPIAAQQAPDKRPLLKKVRSKESKNQTQEIPSRAARVEPEHQLDLVRDTSLVADFPEEDQVPDRPKRSSTERAIDRWADVAVPLGAAPVEIETDDIKRKVGKIIGRYGWQAWEKGLSEVAQSPWLLGKQPGFNGSYRDPVTLDWVADDRNFSKIVNGGYRGMAKAVTDVPRPRPMQVEGTPGLKDAVYAKYGLKAP